jgi:hypothetical protein
LNTEVLLYVLLSDWVGLALTLVFFVGLVLALRRTLRGAGDGGLVLAFGLLLASGAMALGLQYVLHQGPLAGESYAAMGLRIGRLALIAGLLRVAGAVALLLTIFAPRRRSGTQ